MEISNEDKLQLYYFLKLGRMLEERLFILYRQGRLPGAVYLGRGQEAATIGTSYALQPGDTIWPTHRDLVAQLPRGMSPGRIFANHFGKVTAPTRGRDGNTHLGDLSLGIFSNVSMLPDGYPVTLGAALAFKLRGERRVALAYCGEGATSRGDWHESLNFASVHQLPAIFVVENNQFAYSTPTRLQFRGESIAQRAAAYDMPGNRVDGNDVFEVYAVAREAVDRARNGGGPTLIEAVTMRMLGHAGHDPFKYVPRELLAEWEKKDPVGRCEARLMEEGLLDEEGRRDMEERITRELEEGLAWAEQGAYPEGPEVTQGVYAAE